MQLAGHRTPSVFRRYDVTSESDLTDAAAKLDAAANRDSFVTVGPAGQRPTIKQRQISYVSSQDAGDAPALVFARSRSYGVWPAKAPCGRW